MNGLVLGKLALVTGAGSGIGKATCQLLAKEGAKVIATDCNLKTVEDTLTLLSAVTNDLHLALELNVGSSDSVNNALQKVLDHYKQPPSVVVNCAGITRDNFLLKMSEADFDEVINVNLKGTYRMTQTFANAMVTSGVTNASIINLASIVGKYGNIGQTNYCASKAAVEIFTRTAAKEFGKFGIRCNSVLPGFIKSPMTDAVPDKVKEKFIPLIAAGRFGNTEEVAQVITFLASDRSSYVNGVSIEVTGGF